MKKTILLMTILSLGMLTACPKNDEVKTFTATFQNYDGTQVDVQTLNEGSTPTIPTTNPERAETDTMVYEFDKWTPEVGPIYENTTYIATYKEFYKLTRSKLKADFGTFVSFVYGDEYTVYDEEDYFEEDQLYSMGFKAMHKTAGDIQSTCMIAKAMLDGYEKLTLVSDVYAMTWPDDGTPGYEIDYLYDNIITFSIGTALIEDYVWVYIEAYGADNTYFIDDIKKEEREKDIVFLNNAMKADLTNVNKRASFVEWLNGENCDLVDSLDLVEGTYAQTNEFDGTDGKFIAFCLGSASKACDLTFNFNYPVTSIIIKASAYWKWDSYNQIFRGDTGSALYSGESLLKDFSRTDTNNKPTEETIVLTFDEKDEVTSFNLSVLDANQRVFINEMMITYIA